MHLNAHGPRTDQGQVPLQNSFNVLSINYADVYSDDDSHDIAPARYVRHRCPGDGHCLMHAMTLSLNSQLHTDFPLYSVPTLLDIVQHETCSNLHNYVEFIRGNSCDIILEQMHNYITHKDYNSTYGDILPMILANALSIDIQITSSDADMQLQTIVKARNDAVNTVVICKSGDHYDAMIPVNDICSCNGNAQLNDTVSPKVTLPDDDAMFNYIDNTPTIHDDMRSRSGISDYTDTTPGTSDGISNTSGGGVEHCNGVITTAPEDIPHGRSHGNSLTPRKGASVHNKFYSDVHRNVGIKLAHINARSLFPKIDEVREIVSRSKVDFLCISETWLDNTISNSEISTPVYSIVRNDRNREGGGVLMYLREGISYSIRHDIMSCSNTAVENIWVELQLSKGMPCLMCCMYRPPAATAEYYSAVLDVMEKASSENKEIVLTGDLNFNYDLDESLSSNPLHFIENMFNMTQIITEKTRVTRTTSTLIDVILTTVPELHYSTNVYHFGFSDHYLIYTCIKVSQPKRQHNTIRYRCYRNFSADAYLADLQNTSVFTDINSLDDIHGTENKWAIWKREFLFLSDRHAPVKVTRVKYRHNPWMTTDILKLMYRRDFIHNKARTSGDPSLWQQYRQLRNSVTSTIKKGQE